MAPGLNGFKDPLFLLLMGGSHSRAGGSRRELHLAAFPPRVFQELLSQAARILSSVDFLGNPMGLLNDVSEGVTGLIKYGNVGGLIRNVAHGVSNSAAKVGSREGGDSGLA